MSESASDDRSPVIRSGDVRSVARSGYHDFELEIGTGRGLEYPLAVINSPAGQTRETMVFPYDELKLDSRLKDLKVALLHSGGARRQILTTEEAAVQDFGKDIFDALLTGEARSLYDMSVQRAREDGKGLRLKLRILPPELARLPWEYLYDERHAEYVSLSRETPVVRFLESHRPIQPLTVAPPLQVLGMIASPSDLPRLDTEREQQRVERALLRLQSSGLVDLTWLETPTWRALQRAMRGGPWHVFHFIGHGGFDRTLGEGVVALADDDGRSHHLSATELGRLLADHHALRLAVLNSCEGATASDEDVFSSTAAVLVRRGIPAVLAMQYEITDRAAIEFARAFYESLADGYPVDGAVAEARKAVSLAVTNTIEWGTPVLFMRTADGVVFDLPHGSGVESKDVVVEIEPRIDDPAEAERLDKLYTDGLSAFWVSDWARAVQRFEAVVAIRPEHGDAASRLEEAQRQLRWSKLHDEATGARASGDWPTAIAALEQLESDGAPFGDLHDLLADCRRREEIGHLMSQAEQLGAAEHWAAAVNVLTQLRDLAPESPDVVEMLSRAEAEVAELERAARLDRLHREALRAMDRGEWQTARTALREIVDAQPDHGDATGLLARCDAELRPPGTDAKFADPPSAVPGAERSRTPRRGRLLSAIAAAIVVAGAAAGVVILVGDGSSTPSEPVLVEGFDDTRYDGTFNGDLWYGYERGEVEQRNGRLQLMASSVDEQAGVWVDGYLADPRQSFDLSFKYRLDAQLDGGLVAVNVGAIAQCLLKPDAAGAEVHAVYCSAGATPDGGYVHEIGPFHGDIAQDRTIRILYSAPARTFGFFVDDMSTAHTFVLDEGELGGDPFTAERRIDLRVHDLGELNGGVSGSIDWIELLHVADDEVDF